MLDRACAILEGRANGMGMPVLRALAIRGHIGGMVSLANVLLDPDGPAYDLKRGIALERLIVRREGLSYQWQNVSTTYRNLGNMAAYRYWLRRSERLGDPEIATERRAFRIRFPYPAMKRWGRYRPYREKLDG